MKLDAFYVQTDLFVLNAIIAQIASYQMEVAWLLKGSTPSTEQ